jgi:hypothetical protein
MTREQFENDLRNLMRADPFKPFVIVMSGDRTIFVDEPAIAFDGGGGGFIDAESNVHFFECEEVREFRTASAESAK